MRIIEKDYVALEYAINIAIATIAIISVFDMNFDGKLWISKY